MTILVSSVLAYKAPIYEYKRWFYWKNFFFSKRLIRLLVMCRGVISFFLKLDDAAIFLAHL